MKTRHFITTALSSLLAIGLVAAPATARAGSSNNLGLTPAQIYSNNLKIQQYKYQLKVQQNTNELKIKQYQNQQKQLQLQNELKIKSFQARQKQVQLENELKIKAYRQSAGLK